MIEKWFSLNKFRDFGYCEILILHFVIHRYYITFKNTFSDKLKSVFYRVLFTFYFTKTLK